jgi:hypothetical protein
MSDENHQRENDRPGRPYQEGKRAGAHPLVVVLTIILGLWFAIWFATPKSKQTAPPANPEATTQSLLEQAESAPIMFTVKATALDYNAIALLVPAQATDSQVASLLKQLRKARLDNTLATMLPPTTPNHKLGQHAVADIYIFSDPKYATAEAITVLSRGAHAPGELYPSAIPFEVAMEHVRGYYRIDLHDTGHPDKGSLGFSDESGVHSKHYRPLF